MFLSNVVNVSSVQVTSMLVSRLTLTTTHSGMLGAGIILMALVFPPMIHPQHTATIQFYL